ncbi:MAG: hypothetical protein PF482_20025 [Desulfobacteraceae bacterium]|nr:hypothetical protein [Desulfobacteraceae bacterium]
MAMRACYNILKTGLSLESDCLEGIKWFDKDYKWFRTSLPSSFSEDVDLRIRVNLKEAAPFIRINGKQLSLTHHPNPEKMAYQMMQWELFARMQDFFLLHAGVVVSNKDAWIIAGLPGMGKTTLVLELLKAGFCFFSDEVCPFHRKTGRIYCFPRTVWVVPNQPVGESAIPNHAWPIRGKKVPIETETMYPPRSLNTAVPRGLIYLDDATENIPSAVNINVCVQPTSIDAFQAALENLRHHSDSREFSFQRSREADVYWQIRYLPGTGWAGRIENLLHGFGDRVWNAYREVRKTPDFLRTPKLTRMNPDTAAMNVIQDMKFGSPVAPMQHHVTESPGKLFMRLCMAMDGLSCYRLTVGRLSETRQLLRSIIPFPGNLKT